MANQDFTQEHLDANLKEFDNYLARQTDMTAQEVAFARMIAFAACHMPSQEQINHGLERVAEANAEYEAWHIEKYGTKKGSEYPPYAPKDAAPPVATRSGLNWGNWEA